MRLCLKCQTKFWSQSAANRICRKCSRANRRLAMYPEQLLQAQRGVKYHNGEPIPCN